MSSIPDRRIVCTPESSAARGFSLPALRSKIATHSRFFGCTALWAMLILFCDPAAVQCATFAITPSSGPQGTTFVQSATGLTPNGTIQRYARNPDGSQSNYGNMTASGSGTLSWSYTSTCSDPVGTYYLW